MSAHFGQPNATVSFDTSNYANISDDSVLLMGQLKEPTLRDKYTRSELIKHIEEYEQYQDDILKLQEELRETVFKVEENIRSKTERKIASLKQK